LLLDDDVVFVFYAAASIILLLGWRNIIDTIHQYELVISAMSLHRMSS